MNVNQFPTARQIAGSITLAATLSALTGIAPSQAAGLPQGPGIRFARPIAVAHRSLPLFRLTRTAPPSAFVAHSLGSKYRFAMENTRLVARDAHHVLQAYVDAESGEAQIFPDLDAHGGAPATAASITQAAAAVFARRDIIPSDATQLRLGDPEPIFSQSASLTADGKTRPNGSPDLLFTYVPAIRYAAGLPVYGNGSQATVGIGNDGSIRALVRRWQAARPAAEVTPSMTSVQIAGSIDAQVRGLVNDDTTVVVDSVTPAYYDGDAKFLQPVYEFEATLHPRAHGAPTEHLRGFVPFGKLAEPLPVLGQRTGPPPAKPQTAGGIANVNEITLGQYANRDGTMQDMANAYLNGFDSVSPGHYGPPIVRTQWYWAYPYEVEANANSYLNAVNVAYTMPHGDWWENTTYSNYADFWYVDQIGVGGNPGYGAASGGQLATWIIDSCEVIPSYYDLQYTTGNGNTAFNNWWPVFQGLHRALGFRTEMLLGEDSMNQNIATSMAMGAGADSAFYNDVAAVNFGSPYLDTHLNLNVHFDRVSIMRDPRNYNESIYAVQGQSASGQLNNVWMGN
jgi:hypothetical protein